MVREPFPPVGDPEDRSSAEVESDTWTLETDLRSPGLTVLYHPRIERIGERSRLADLSGGRSRLLARGEPLFAQPDSALSRPLGTKRLSRTPIVLSPALGVGVRIDPAESRTTVEIEGRPLTTPANVPFSRLDPGVVLLLGQQIVLLLHLQEIPGADGLPAFGRIGESPATLKLRQDIERTAELSLPVLLVGEAGTDRESVARALQAAGPRRDGPFVSLDVGDELLVDDGDERLRAARQAARGGFLYLRGLERCSVAAQGLLRHGLDAEAPDAPRLVCSSLSDLDPSTFDRPFDPVLRQQLSGFVMRVPPLRDRKEDFGRLFVHFLTRELEAAGEPLRLEGGDPPWLPAVFWARLAAYPWPGNDRRLEETARRLVADNRGSEVVTDTSALKELT